MKKTKTVCKSLLFLVTVFLLSGCWDREELEDKAYVIGLGLDHSKLKGKSKSRCLLPILKLEVCKAEVVQRKSQEKSSHLMPMISLQRKAQPMR